MRTNGLQLTHEKIQQVQLLFCAWGRGGSLVTLGIDLCIAKEALFELAIKYCFRIRHALVIDEIV